MIIKRAGSTPSTVLVTFQMPASIWAETVHVVGDFNNWDLWATPLTRSDRDGGPWKTTLALKKDGAYQFRYLIDGVRWYNDCAADRYVPNVFGGDNSLLAT